MGSDRRGLGAGRVTVGRFSDLPCMNSLCYTILYRGLRFGICRGSWSHSPLVKLKDNFSLTAGQL